ncbi:MAG: hypothetical protein KDE46_00980 [Caldilineaceae bacterium]|nr:hypothetical protein [Caldilineaceae bacterium]
MDKQWLFIIHREYVNSLRRVVSDQDRYQLGVAIRDRLEKAEDPTLDATPVANRPGRFTIELMGYLITFEVPVDANNAVLKEADYIILLPIETAKTAN